MSRNEPLRGKKVCECCTLESKLLLQGLSTMNKYNDIS